MYLELTLFAYFIDRIFGEFNFIKHPIIFMGDYIKWYEKKFYSNNIINGFFLTISLISITAFISYLISFLPFIIQVFIASMGIASKMLYQSVKDIINNPQNIKYLVSRDTQELTRSDINKAAIETYGENLNDGVIAPLFYLFFFGIVGLFVYKSINTLDSMVGYKNEKYINFGKISAILDDIVNYIPARLTALLFVLLYVNINILKDVLQYAKLHESPNAGYGITAIASMVGISLGGDTKYFGKLKKKPYFGNGRKTITTADIQKALSFQIRFDILIFTITFIELFNR